MGARQVQRDHADDNQAGAGHAITDIGERNSTATSTMAAVPIAGHSARRRRQKICMPMRDATRPAA